MTFTSRGGVMVLENRTCSQVTEGRVCGGRPDALYVFRYDAAGDDDVVHHVVARCSEHAWRADSNTRFRHITESELVVLEVMSS